MESRLRSNEKTTNNFPNARHYPKSKQITVTYYFRPTDKIKAKLILHRDEWFNLWDELDFTNVAYKSVESFFSDKTSQKNRDALKEYASQYPDHFSDDFFKCVYLANFENPEFRPPKPRKPSRYELDKAEKWKISNTAIRLYIYLRNIIKQPERSWPRYVKQFLKVYNIPKANLNDDLILKQDIREVIIDYYGIEFGERFWQTFVTESPISLRRLKNSPRVITPESDQYLAELFKEFID
jgi:hypothetical protein